MIDDSLLEHLAVQSSAATQDQLAEIVAAHRFPFALSQRPLRSLSPGERVRAAFICIFHRAPTPEVLVLDEPTFSLDLVGQRARTNALAAWPGGLLVASHDRAFLNAVGFDRFVALGSSSPRLDTSTPRPRRTATKH